MAGWVKVAATLLLLAGDVVAQPAQQTAGRALDDIEVEVIGFTVPDDGYWKFLPVYRTAEDARRSNLTAVKILLARNAKLVKSKRRQWFSLMATENAFTPSSSWDPAWGPYLQSFIGTSDLGTLWDQFLLSWSWQRRDMTEEEALSTVRGVLDPFGAGDTELAGWMAWLYNGYITQTVGGVPVPDASATLGPAASRHYRSRRDALAREINALKQQQRDEIDAVLEATELIADMVGKQRERSDPYRPWLVGEEERLRGELPWLRAELMILAGLNDRGELNAAIEALIPLASDNPALAHYLQAQRWLAFAASDDDKLHLQVMSPRKAPPDEVLTTAGRRGRLMAVQHLRLALAEDEDNGRYRSLLADTELHLVSELSRQLTLERKLNMNAFASYLQQRGFSIEERNQPGMIRQILWTWYSRGATLFWEPFILNTPALQAEAVAIADTMAAENIVALMYVKRLLKNGVLLQEVNSLSFDELSEAMVMRRADRTPLPKEQARSIYRTIKELFAELTVMSMLVSNNSDFPVMVNRQFGKSYYGSIDPNFTWTEMGVDFLTSGSSLAFMWGPGALTKLPKGHRFYASSSQIRTALQAGEIQTGKEALRALSGQFMGKSDRLKAIADKLGNNQVAAWWGRRMSAYRDASSNLTAISSVADAGTKLTAAMMIYGGAAYLAEEYNIPGGQVLVELLSELGPSDLLYDALSRAEIPLARLATKLDDFDRALNLRKLGINRLQDVLDEAAQLAEDAAEGGAKAAVARSRARYLITQLDEFTVVGNMNGPPVVRSGATQPPAGTVPANRPPATGTPISATATKGILEPVRVPHTSDEAAGHAARSALEAVANGDKAETKRALDVALQILRDSNDEIADSERKIRLAIQALDSAQSMPALHVDELLNVNTAIGNRSLGQLINDSYPESLFDAALYVGDDSAAAGLRAARARMRDGDLEGAWRNFQAVQKTLDEVDEQALSAGEKALLQKRRELVRSRIDLLTKAHHVKQAQKLRRARVPSQPGKAPLTAAQEAAVLAKLQANDFTVAGGGTNKPKKVTITDPDVGCPPPDGCVYFVKQLVADANSPFTAGLTPQQIAEIHATEAAASQLADTLGLDAVKAHHVNAGGESLLIIRGVDGSQMNEYGEHVLLAYQEEWVMQRMFRAWLGDTDGHMGNAMIGKDGRFWLLDFDMATLTRNESRHVPGLPDDMRQFMDMVVSQHHSPNVPAMYRMMGRADQMASFDLGKKMIDRIEDLVLNRPDELREILRRSGLSADAVEQAVTTLTERARVMREVMKELFEQKMVAMHLPALPMALERVA